MTAARVSRWSRRYVLASLLFLLAWQVGVVIGISSHAAVILGLYGFVLHTIFGKAYSLVPTYFDREIAFARAPAVQFPFVATGVTALAGAALRVGPPWLAAVGAALWTVGVGVFLGTLLWTVRGNLTGGDTATGEVNADRQPVDRWANALVPVALLYLAVGSYETLAVNTGAPPLLDGYFPRVVHLLAAGTASVSIFALGFRLLPRFAVAFPPRSLVAVVLPTGAVAPAVLATHLGDSPWFQLGAFLEAVAVGGFAVAVGALFVRSTRRRVGFSAVSAGALSGVVAVVFGLYFAFDGPAAALVRAHRRLNLLGFLGLTIVGVAYQFYPPAVGAFRLSSDRTALVSVGCLTGGLFAQVVGLLARMSLLTDFGEVLALCGALLYAYLIVAVFAERRAMSRRKTNP